MSSEKVLVISASLFNQLGDFQGLNPNIDHYLPQLLDPTNNHFMDRQQAEEDFDYKQLIPYVLFSYQNQLLHYVRGKSGGESRLHQKGSLGIGGHINPIDKREDPLGKQTYLASVEREINEELSIRTSYTQKIVGLINDDSTEVGQVHLGVLHVFELEEPKIASSEDAIKDLRFLDISELRAPLVYNNLETWSQLALSFFN